MKKFKTWFRALMAIVLALQLQYVQAQQTCENFNNGNVGTWQATGATRAISTAPPTADGTNYLRAVDGSGASSLFNNSYNATTSGCGTICFDYKVFNDGVTGASPNMINTIRINAVVNGQPLSAIFQLTNPITENTPWLNICAPLNWIGPGAPLPGNNQGTWLMTAGTNAQWNNLVSGYTQVAFNTDVAGSSFQTEVIGIDNFCFVRGNCCETFNTSATGSWGATAATISISTTPPMADGTPYLQANDASGASSIFNTAYNAQTVGCGTICFDYKVFNDGFNGTSPGMINTIRITAVVGTQTFSAVFQLANPITENSPWLNICVPLNVIAPGAPLPANGQGSWLMTAGTNADWNALVTNYSQISFATDVAGSSFQTEVIGIDNICTTFGVCCDPNPNSGFTINTSCNNGVITVTVTANDQFPGIGQWWGLMETTDCGNTNDNVTVDGDPSTPATIDPVAPVQGGTTATFTITDLSKCYYIKHGIWQNGCFNWQETRIAVPLFNANNVFNLEDVNGTPKTEFCYGEDVYLDGTASTGENAYYIDIWRRPIGSPPGTPFTWVDDLGWFNGQVGIMNLSQAFAGQIPPVYFQPGYEYQVKLALQNIPNCIGWTEKVQTFTVVCCDGFINGCFAVNVKWGTNTYTMEAVNFNTYANIGAVHEWYVLSSPNPSGGPYTPITSFTTTTQNPVPVYTDAEPGLYYFVIHKVITACGEVCTEVVQFQDLLRTGKTEEVAPPPCKPIDCCFVFDYWPNGAGSDPATLDGSFVIDPNDLGNNQYSISAINFSTYSNPAITHQWYVFSSPNPTGGPYTLVHQQTGTNLYYAPANYGTYYFVIHRLKTPCGEICFGRSICFDCKNREMVCELCLEIDCSIVDSLLNPCATPANLTASCATGILSWDPVPGATSYVVEVGFNDPACCRSPIPPTGMRYEVRGNSFDIRSVPMPEFYCFSWKVMAKCAKGESAWSAIRCFNCKDGGVIGKASVQGNEKEKVSLQPIVAPNPNKGSMNLYLNAPGDLTVSIEVYNNFGKLVEAVKQTTVPGGLFAKTLTLNNAQKGLFTIVFRTNYGVFSKKVIVE